MENFNYTAKKNSNVQKKTIQQNNPYSLSHTNMPTEPFVKCCRNFADLAVAPKMWRTTFFLLQKPH